MGSETMCWGSCECQANVDCQVSCQSETFTECETEVTEECKNDCETTGIAIFCDGQFLASADDLEACAADIKTEFTIELDVHVEAEAEVDVEIEGDGDGDDDNPWDCSMAPNSNRPRPYVGLITLFLDAFLQ